MRRPTERAGEPDVQDLSDAEAPDFLEAHEVALLAFVDPKDPSSQKLRARLAVVAAKVTAAATTQDEAAASSALGVGVVDVTRHRLVAEALGVKGVPMVVVFAGGNVVDRVIGSPPESILEDVLKTRLRR